MLFSEKEYVRCRYGVGIVKYLVYTQRIGSKVQRESAACFLPDFGHDYTEVWSLHFNFNVFFGDGSFLS